MSAVLNQPSGRNDALFLLALTEHLNEVHKMIKRKGNLCLKYYKVRILE